MVLNDAREVIGDARSVVDVGHGQIPPDADLNTGPEFEAAQRELQAAQQDIDRAEAEISPDSNLPPPPTIKDRAKELRKKIITPDISEKTFIDSEDEREKAIVAELEEANVELTRNPEKAKKILDEMDADALLMRKVIESRAGIRGVVSRLDEFKIETKIGKRKFQLPIGAIGKGTRVLAGNAIAAGALSFGLHALKLANPVVGAMTGGALGGFWGYIRGRNKQESASRWAVDVDIVGRGREDFEKMSTVDLEMAIGVINNAVHAGKVRGGSEELMSLMRTYRTMKEVSADRAKATNEKYPFDEVTKKLLAEADIGKAITAGAREKYSALYKEITEGKKKQIWASAIKGAVVGASIGGLLGWATSKFAGAGSHGQESQLADKAQALRAEHAGNVDIVNTYNQNAAPPGGNWDVFNQHAEIIQHTNNLLGTPGAHVDGFTQPGLEHFGQMLQSNTSLHNLVHEAGLNNIDLSASVGHGQTLGNFLMQNKDSFLQLPVEVQRQVLSFPSLATEIMIPVATATSDVAAAGIATAVMGGVGLGVVGFDMGRKGKEKVSSSYDKAQAAGKESSLENKESLGQRAKELEDTKKAEEEAKKTETAAEKTAKKAEKETTKKNSIEAARRDIIGSEVVFYGFPLGEGRSFRVENIDAEGQLKFLPNDVDADKMRKGEIVFPVVYLEDIVNKNGNLDRSKIEIILSGSRTERKTASADEVADFERMKKESAEVPEKYFDAEIIPAGKGTYRGKEVNNYKIKIGSGPARILTYENSTAIESASLSKGGKCQVKIKDFMPSDKFEGKVYRVTIKLKPEEESPPTPPTATPPTPTASEPTPGPTTEPPTPPETAPVEELTGFKDQGVLDEDEIDDFDSYVKQYSLTLKSPNPSERVVLKTPEGKYYRIDITNNGEYLGRPFDPVTGDTAAATQGFVMKDISAGDHSWFLENK